MREMPRCEEVSSGQISSVNRDLQLLCSLDVFSYQLDIKMWKKRPEDLIIVRCNRINLSRLVMISTSGTNQVPGPPPLFRIVASAADERQLVSGEVVKYTNRVA